MDGGTLFRVRTEARTRVLKEMSEIRLHKNKFGGYAYNDVNTLITKIERVLKRYLYEDSANGMKGLASAFSNALNDFKLTVHIKKRNVLAALIAAAKRASTNDSTVKPDIANNSSTQDKADRENLFRLMAISVKEGIMEGVTKIVGRDITNPILRTTDNINFKSVYQFQIHNFFTAITDGTERPELTNIRRQFVNISGTIFDWRETVVTNVKRMAAMPAKSLGYGVSVHSDLHAVMILVNTKWATQQTWEA